MEELYLESKREIQPAASLSLRRSSLAGLGPIIMEVQLVKIELFSTDSFLQERQTCVLAQIASISLSALPPMRKQFVSPFLLTLPYQIVSEFRSFSAQLWQAQN